VSMLILELETSGCTDYAWLRHAFHERMVPLVHPEHSSLYGMESWRCSSGVLMLDAAITPVLVSGVALIPRFDGTTDFLRRACGLDKRDFRRALKCMDPRVGMQRTLT